MHLRLRLGGLLLLVSTLAAPRATSAATWHGVSVGTTNQKEVIAQFGPPSKSTDVGQKRRVLYYLGTRAIKGTRQVHFRINLQADDVVDRIDVFPRNGISRKAVENSIGPRCSATITTNCYEEKLGDDNILSLHYATLGLFVFLKSNGDVETLTYVAPPPKAPVGADNNTTTNAQATPETNSPVESPVAEKTVFSNQEPTIPEDALRIGGMIYAREDATFGAGKPIGLLAFNSPSIVDVYMDARPTEHVRGMILARLTYDPALSVSNPFHATLPAPSNPDLALDQLWLRFDLAGTWFIEVGRQHVKWGTTHFWSPADFLTPLRRDLLAVFDTRLGTDMVRLSVPFLGTANNLSLVGLATTNPNNPSEVQFGAAARAEVVVEGAEFGVSSLIRQAQRPRFGVDVSTGLGPIDLYAEYVFRTDTDAPVWTLVPAPASAGYAAQFQQSTTPHAPYSQATVGVTWNRKLSETTSFSVGVEAYYNQAGYTDARLLPWLISQLAYEPFYAARYYAAGYVSWRRTDVDPLSIQQTFIGNLSDFSFISRTDLIVKILTVLDVETFLQIPFGTVGGEFRFAADLPPEDFGFPVTVPLPYAEIGIAFRLKF